MVTLAAQAGQAPTGISQNHKPGDTLRYTVSFDGDPNFSYVGVAFRKNGPVDSNQPGLRSGFGIDHFTKVKSGVFDVEGIIPPNTAAGIYDLFAIDTAIAPAGRQTYDASRFKLTITIRNEEKYDFPPLKSVTPN